MANEFGAVLSLKDNLTNPLMGATKGLGKFDKQANLSAKAVGGIDSAIKGLVGGLGIIAGVGKLFQLGGELGETQNKFNVVFGDMAEDTEMWINKMGKAWNKSTVDIKTALASNQDLLTGFGASTEAAADMSKNFVTLATDVASFANVPAAEAMDRVTSAMLGNHEAVKALGVVLNEASLDQTALTLGYRKSFRDLSPLEKMQVRYATAVEQTKNAQGDATNTAWSFVNVLQGLRSWAKDTASVVGIGLTTAFGGLARDALKALSIISVGQDEATSTGERLEPVVRNLTKAYLAYKIGLIASWTWQKALIAAELLGNGIMVAKKALLTSVAAGTIAYSAATMGATGVVAVFKGGMAALNAVLFANPIGLVILAVTAIGAAFVIAFKKSEKFRNGVMKLWETLKNAPVIGGVLKGGEALTKFFLGDGKAPNEKQEVSTLEPVIKQEKQEVSTLEPVIKQEKQEVSKYVVNKENEKGSVAKSASNEISKITTNNNNNPTSIDQSVTVNMQNANLGYNKEEVKNEVISTIVNASKNSRGTKKR